VLPAAAFGAAIFDLDGVVTDTASVHARAWTEVFDDFLGRHGGASSGDRRPFTHDDYLTYVDGRPRRDGVTAFLAARGIEADDTQVEALAVRKDARFRDLLEREGVRVFDSTVRLIGELRSRGVPSAIVSSSRNCSAVLEAAGLSDTFEVQVDGVDAALLGLPGKPDPATFLEASRRLRVSPDHTLLVEDATSGVRAGRRGEYATVIGVDRGGHAAALRDAGADEVVSDLGEVVLQDDLTPLSSQVQVQP
jgi:alpha,alpha-trehalase